MNSVSDWLLAGGQMGQMIRDMDWSATPLGPRDGWPETLRAAVNLIVSSSFPMVILWGDDLIMIYNDAYVAIAAQKHPRALGRSPREIWAEVWSFHQPIYEKVMKLGQTVHLENQPMHLFRRGFMEEAYFTLSYSPIRLGLHQIGGTLVTLLEIPTSDALNWLMGRLPPDCGIRDLPLPQGAVQERERTLQFLHLINTHTDVRSLVDASLGFFRQLSGCEALGLRLRQDQDYPYYQTYGFTELFLQKERTLCARDANGDPVCDAEGRVVLECLCGSLLSGQTLAIAPRGNFWTPSTSELAPRVSEKDLPAHPRFRCVQEGYETTAVIVLRVGENRLGLLHLCDRRKGVFSAETFALMERLAGYLSVALEKLWTKEAHREGEAKFRTLFENTMDAIFMTRPDGTILAANPAACTLFGMSQQELINAGYQGICDNTDPRQAEALAEHQRTGRFRGELRHIRKDGSVFPAEIESANLTPSSEIAFVIIRDISERQETLQRLHQARIQAESRAADIAQKKLGLQKLNRTLRALSHSNHAIMEAIDEKAYLQKICEIIIRDCGHRMAWVGYASRDAAQSIEVIAYAGAEQGYLQNVKISWADNPLGQGPTGTSIRSAQSAIFNDVRNDPRFRPWIEKAAQCGFTSVIGLPLIHEGQAFGALTIYSEESAPFTNDEEQLLRELAGNLSHGISSLRLRESNARALAALQASEERYRSLSDTLEAANKAKDHFLAVLSHELRNPLNPILAAATMLRGDPRLDLTTHQQLEIIARNALLEARLIDDLLDLTRIERGKIELDRQRVDLGAILRHTQEICLSELKAKELSLSFQPPQKPYWIEGDTARLQQVFWNILNNAIKFTPKGGQIHLACRRDGEGFVTVEIRDSGLGIEPAALERIFNAFEQAERSITRQFGGLGLGLTISKAVVELHGGTIHAASSGYGLGATIRVRLPLLSDEALFPPPAPVIPQASLPTRPLQILLVEDHVDTLGVMNRFLSAEGHRVENASDIQTALRLLEYRRFDLLLSDLGLPDGSGLELMQALRGRGLTLPGIALSGYGQKQDLQKSHDAGFEDHFIKPVNLLKLTETIARIAAR